MNAFRNGAQSLRSVINRIHGCHHRQQTLGGANVGCGFVAPNVLFSGLERHSQRRLTKTVDGHADDSSWEMALERFPRCKKCGVRASVTHRHPKPLRAPHHNIRTHCSRTLQDEQRHEIRCKYSSHFSFSHVRNEACRVFGFAICVRVLHQTSKHIACFNGTPHGFSRHDNHVNVEVRRPRAQHAQRLRKHRIIDEKSVRSRLDFRTWTSRKKHGHGLRCGRPFIEQGCVCHFHSCEVHDHGLEVQQRFKPSLGNFRLVWGVSRVPSRVLQHISANDARHFRGVIPHADVVAEHRVLGSQTIDVLQVFTFCQCLGNTQPLAQPNGTGDSSFNQVIQRGSSKGAEHGVLVFQSRTQVARDKTSNLHVNQENERWARPKAQKYIVHLGKPLHSINIQSTNSNIEVMGGRPL